MTTTDPTPEPTPDTCERDCDCECHDAGYGDEWEHPGYTCVEQRAWLDEDVQVVLTSLQNVTYRHVVTTGLTRRDWLDTADDELDRALSEVVAQHVEVTVLDDPRDERRGGTQR
jgi:hypothetical protein